MQKTKRRILYVAMAAMLIVLQLSNALLALADGKTALKVSDVGDKELYALLAAATDAGGNNGGILYKEDAESLTYLYLSNSNLYETAGKVESFENLATICPNITSIDDGGVVNTNARDSFFAELAKFDKLCNIEVNVYTQEQLADLFGKEGKDNLTYLRISLHNDTTSYDISDLLVFENLINFYLYVSNSNDNVKGIEKITDIKKLNTLTLKGYNGALFQEIIDKVPDTLSGLELSYYKDYSSDDSTKTEVSVDLSRLTQLNSVDISGVDAVTGLDKLGKANHGSWTSVYIYGNGTTKVNFSSISDKVNNLHLYGCALEDGTSISKIPSSLHSLEINNCDITDINVSNATSLGYLDVSGNKLTALPDLTGLSLYQLEIANNKITDISGVLSLDNHARLSYFNACNNGISTLPDLSSFISLTGGRYENDYSGKIFESDYYRLSLSGNKLTKDAIKGKVPSECENDIYWMYSATTLLTESGQLYYPEIDTTLVSKYVEANRNTIYTSQKEFTFDEELVKYIKGLKNRDDWYRLYINYINDDAIGDSVSINPKEIPDDTNNFTVTFDELERGTSNEELDAVFSKYGEIEKYYVSNGKKDSGISGVTYGDANVYVDLNNQDEDYHEYIYNPESKTFAFVDYVKKGHNINVRNNSADKGMIYFFVPDSKDSLMDTYHIKYNENSSYIYNCYTQLNDDVINGRMMLDSINSSLGYYHNYSLQNGADINISKDVISKMKSNKYSMHFNVMDNESGSSKIYADIYYNNLKEQDIKSKLPTMTKKDGSTLQVPFPGGQPDYVYDIDNTADNCGIKYSFMVNSTNYNENELGNNIYKVVGQSYIPLQLGNWGYSMSVPEGVKEQVFVIAAAKDEYMKTAVVEDGEYKGRSYTYLNKTDSDEIKKLLSASLENNNNNRGCNINVITDKIEINDDIIKLVKTKEDNSSSSHGVLTFKFINTNTGDYDSEAVIYNNSFRNKDITGPITIKKPELEVSTNNQEFEKLLPADSYAVYMNSDIDESAGVSYYANKNMLNYRFGKDLFNTGEYQVFIINNSGRLSKTAYTNSSSTVPLRGRWAAYVQAANYVTPSDTTPSDTTPSDIPTKPASTPSDLPTEATTKETETAKPEETTKETEATKPEETTKETEATKPEETTKETESTTPEETTKEPEATKPGTGDGENNGEITKPDTDTEGKNVAPEVVAKEDIIDVAEVNNNLIENIVDSKLAEISVTSSAAPKLNSNVFSQMKSKQKDITIGVTDDNDRLKYQWKFNSDTITQPDMNIDLSISFDTDRAEAVKEITGRDDVMYLSFAHHGALPGPATIKTYVGNQYKDGDIVYLYYFNEEENRVESVGGVNKGLVVKNGYVEYTITHCSLYFLSTAMAEDVNAVEPDKQVQGSEVVSVPDKVNDTTPTGDTRNATVYVMETIIALAVIGGLVYSRKRRV